MSAAVGPHANVTAIIQPFWKTRILAASFSIRIRTSGTLGRANLEPCIHGILHTMRAILDLSGAGILVVSLLGAAAHAADAETNHELNKYLEDNAVASAYALMCEEETVSDQLKANTMVLLVVNGLPPHNVQLGSVKYNEIMRREVAATTNFKSLDCSTKIADAKARLAQTQQILQATHRPEPK